MHSSTKFGSYSTPRRNHKPQNRSIPAAKNMGRFPFFLFALQLRHSVLCSSLDGETDNFLHPLPNPCIKPFLSERPINNMFSSHQQYMQAPIFASFWCLHVQPTTYMTSAKILDMWPAIPPLVKEIIHATSLRLSALLRTPSPIHCGCRISWFPFHVSLQREGEIRVCHADVGRTLIPRGAYTPPAQITTAAEAAGTVCAQNRIYNPVALPLRFWHRARVWDGWNAGKSLNT